MDKDTLRQVQLTQLEIAKEIKRVCDSNNIRYWLDSGTLLGAVRHKGFIPWDDDLDIGMWREDYERFMSLAPQKLSSQFYLQNWETDKNYGLPFAKVRKKGTIYIENKAKNSHANNGIYVDIFPYDNFGDDYEKQGKPIKIIKLLLQNKAKVQVWHENSSINYKKLFQHLPFALAAPFFDRNKLIKKYEELATKYNNETCDYYFPQGISNYGKWLIPVPAMKELIDLKFEDTTFKAPSGFDAYLKNAYGDYMKLPPEDKRENRHQIIQVKF